VWPSMISGQVKKHELIRPIKKGTYQEHRCCQRHTGLVFLVYSARETIDRIVDRVVKEDPEYDFIFDNGVRHMAWVVSDERRLKASGLNF